MSTRSVVGINDNGTIRSVYVHHDGYLDGVGLCLLENYKDAATVRKLIELGDMSVLGSTIEDCETYVSRGEDLNIDECEDVDNFVYELGDHGDEYRYLFDTATSTWFYLCEDQETLRKLTPAAIAGEPEPQPMIIAGSQYELEKLHKALSALVGIHSETERVVTVGDQTITIRKS